MRLELLWFDGCPHHEEARAMLRDALAARSVDIVVEDIEVVDEDAGNLVRFPGSPTIRVDGRDIEPGFEGCEDCTLRCRVYPTPHGLRGLPEQDWLDEAIDRAMERGLAS